MSKTILIIDAEITKFSPTPGWKLEIDSEVPGRFCITMPQKAFKSLANNAHLEEGIIKKTTGLMIGPIEINGSNNSSLQIQVVNKDEVEGTFIEIDARILSQPEIFFITQELEAISILEESFVEISGENYDTTDPTA